MPNSADQLIYYAASLLDEEEDVAGAMNALRDAINLSETARYPLQLVRARLMLGELLAGAGEWDAARKEFADVIALEPMFAEEERSLVDEEMAAAREYLSEG